MTSHRNFIRYHKLHHKLLRIRLHTISYKPFTENALNHESNGRRKLLDWLPVIILKCFFKIFSENVIFTFSVTYQNAAGVSLSSLWFVKSVAFLPHETSDFTTKYFRFFFFFYIHVYLLAVFFFPVLPVLWRIAAYLIVTCWLVEKPPPRAMAINTNTVNDKFNPSICSSPTKNQPSRRLLY